MNANCKSGATAIVRGALLLGSNPSIMKDVRIPHGYAIVNDEPWDKSIHGSQVTKTKCSFEKRLMVPDRVEVLVQKVSERCKVVQLHS
jgi:hypothetical protein